MGILGIYLALIREEAAIVCYDCGADIEDIEINEKKTAITCDCYECSNVVVLRKKTKYEKNAEDEND